MAQGGATDTVSAFAAALALVDGSTPFRMASGSSLPISLAPEHFQGSCDDLVGLETILALQPDPFGHQRFVGLDHQRDLAAEAIRMISGGPPGASAMT